MAKQLVLNLDHMMLNLELLTIQLLDLDVYKCTWLHYFPSSSTSKLLQRARMSTG